MTASRTLLRSLAAIVAATLPPLASAQTGPAEGKDGLVELSRFDERLKGHYAPKGFKVEIVAAEPTIIDPTGMAFDDKGNLFVAEWRVADHMLDTWDTVKLPDGSTTKVMRRRKSVTDVVKWLGNKDAKGVYQSSTVVVDGAEMPASIFPWKNSLYLTCTGRLEKWTDEDRDGSYESRSIVADGFCGFYHHWLSGMTLGADGWLYLTAGDNDNHVVGSDGSRVEVSRCGAIFRGKVDGSRMNLFAMGFRNPYRDVAINGKFDVFHVDNDQEEGSKFQGVRLVNPVEGGDYGWRLRPGAPCCQTDFDRGAVSGELPGKLPIIAKTGRGAPAGLLIYEGTAFPDAYRGMLMYPDVFRKSVRGYRVDPKGGSYGLREEVTLMTADDDLFRPCQAVVGPDGAIYVLDWRSNSGGAGRLWGDAKYGRLYKLTWEGDGATPALPIKENSWARVLDATDDGLLAMIRGKDGHESRRALRELVERSSGVIGGKEIAGADKAAVEAERARRSASIRSTLLALMNDRSAPPEARLLGLQGARQLWDEGVEAAMVKALGDPMPEARRLAAQALSWEPTTPKPALVAPLLSHLDDADDHVKRDVALAVGTHGRDVPDVAAPPLLAWLLAHPAADSTTRDACIRGLERLGRPGVAAVASLIKSANPDRSAAVAIFTAFRTEPASAILPSVATADGLTGADRAALVRMFKDIPLNIPTPTQPIADWVVAHRDAPAEVKVAALDVCRLGGNPAAGLVIALLDDPDEAVRMASASLAAQSRPAGAIESMAARLARPETSLGERVALAKSLRSAGPAAFEALASAYRSTEAADFRRVALRSLADVDRAKASPIIEAAGAAGQPAELRADAIQILGETPQTALALGRAYLDGKLDKSDLPGIRAAVRKFDDADHREVAAKIEAAVEAATASLSAADLRDRVAKGADPWAGLAVYRREAGARCYSCHKVEGWGGNVGPDLSGAGSALSVEKMIESILEPSKEIKEGFEAYRVGLKNGKVLSGIKVAQDEKGITLKDAGGQETRIPAEEVEEQVRDSSSIMPAGLLGDLSPEEIAQMVAFLRSKPAQESLHHDAPMAHWVGVGPFAPGADPGPVPVDKLDPGATFTGQSGSTLSWVAMDVASNGKLNVRGQFGLQPGRAYLATAVRSAGPQEVAFRPSLPGPAAVFLNGAKVADLPAPTSSAPVVHLSLADGPNTLVLVLDRPATAAFDLSATLGSARPVEVHP